MIRKRLVIVLTFNNGVLFRTKLFCPDYRYTLNFVDAWSVDEIVMLDITRPGEGSRTNFLETVTDFSARCFVPISVGGGIRTLDDARELMQVGADKIVVNTGALLRPDLVSEIASHYGSQCVVVSIDAKKLPNNNYEVVGRSATWGTRKTPVDWAIEVEALGAGEILFTVVDRDGWLQGYDLGICREVCASVRLPVLLLGGAGNWRHFQDALEMTDASGVCTQNIYHFTESSIQNAKQFLFQAGLPVRI